MPQPDDLGKTPYESGKQAYISVKSGGLILPMDFFDKLVEDFALQKPSPDDVAGFCSFSMGYASAALEAGDDKTHTYVNEHLGNQCRD